MNIKHIMLVCILFLANCKNDTQVANIAPYLDTTFNGYDDRLKNDPTFADAIKAQDIRLFNFIAGNQAIGTTGVFSGIVTIPVVVHIVHNTATPAENVSDATVLDQINALNRDFRMQDVAAIAALPLAFRNKATDTRIQFVLAKRTNICTVPTNPNGAINRVTTSNADFGMNTTSTNPALRNPVKFAASGGTPGWPSTDYLNIWVCDLNGSNSGYASLPVDLTTRGSEDGVVVDYEFFGNGISRPTRNMGKTCSKVVAKWLGLFDIWGTSTNGCADSDFSAANAAFDDTPNQDDATTGCPTGVQISCSNGPDGDNYQNLMDETDDACRSMFTCGQADIMNAVLATRRIGIINSNAMTPPTTAPQLWVKDAPEDTGSETVNPSPTLYLSDDIWVRNQNDGSTNQEHQDARSASGNFVYVRVRNPGCGATVSANVKLYWAKASGSLSWPAPWDHTVITPVVMGDLVGTQASGIVPSAGSTVLTFPWPTPNVADYSTFGTDAGHFCLLAEVQNSANSTLVNYPGNLWDYVKFNREVAWKNIGVTALGGPSVAPMVRMFSTMLMGNFTAKPVESKLIFNNLANESSVFDYGKVYLKGPVVKKWLDSDKQGSGVHLEGDSIIIEKATASIEGLKFDLKELQSVYIGYDPKPDASGQRKVYKLNVEEYQKKDSLYQVVGGQIFTLKDEFDAAPKNTGGNGNEGKSSQWWYYLVGALLALLAYFLLRKKG